MPRPERALGNLSRGGAVWGRAVGGEIQMLTPSRGNVARREVEPMAFGQERGPQPVH